MVPSPPRHDSGRSAGVHHQITSLSMTADESSGHCQQQIAKFKDLFTALPVRETYEVGVQAQNN
jgi:hypothetical protein